VFERFVARQPIFDRRLNVFGYELLFRSGPDNHFTLDEHATAKVIVDSTMLLRLDGLVGTGKAFLNMTPEELQSGSAFLLSNSKSVIEINALTDLSVETILACQNLQHAGFPLALDGFQRHPRWKPVLRFASFLKVDFRATSREEQKLIAREFSGNELKLIGKGIETREEYSRAHDAGYSFFQGFFFLQPELIVARDLPADKLNCLRLLRESAAPELRYNAIEQILKDEPALLYKLLRHLNSAALGLAREVHSVPHAVSLLGEKEFRRWVNVVALVAAARDEPVEVLRSALIRAYFCEGLSQLVGMAERGTEFFLMGLLSVTEVLFARPLSDILEELPLSADIRYALLGGRNLFREVYEAVLTYERADWEPFQSAANRAKLVQALVAEQYEAAVCQASRVQDQSDR
jgi:EAL and modified HD-GYP domain-containing signal transduction protein